MKRVALAVFKKEIKEVLRDPRTLVLAIFLPLFFYPLMLGISFEVSKDQQQQQQQKTLVVAEQGVPDELKDGADIQWVSEANLEGLELDASLIYREGFVLGYHSTANGERAKVALLALLEDYQNTLIKRKLKATGVSVNILDPFQVKVEKVELNRSELGKLVGGAGAYFIIFLAFTGCMSVAVDAGSGERERGTLEAMTATSASMLGIALGKFSFVLLMGLASVLSTFVGIAVLLIWQGGALEHIAQVVDPKMAIQVVAMLVAIVVFFAALLYGVSLLAKSSREAHLRASVMMMLVVVALVIAGASPLSNQSWVWFVPVLNAAEVIKLSLAGTLSMFQWMISVGTTVAFSVIFLFLVSYIFKRFPEKAYLAE